MGTSKLDEEPIEEPPLARLKEDGIAGTGVTGTGEDVEDREDEELFGILRSVAPGREMEGNCGDESAAELLPVDETFEGRRALPGRKVALNGCCVCDAGVGGIGRLAGVDDRSDTAVAAYA